MLLFSRQEATKCLVLESDLRVGERRENEEKRRRKERERESERGRREGEDEECAYVPGDLPIMGSPTI